MAPKEQNNSGLVPSLDSRTDVRASDLVRRGLDAVLKRQDTVKAGESYLKGNEGIIRGSVAGLKERDPSKPDFVHKWRTEEPSLSNGHAWVISVQACRYDGEEIMGWGWVSIDEPDSSVATFHQEAATALLRTLYSAFTALHDPDDYLKQTGFAWVLGSPAAPKSASVGGASDYGSADVHVDWSPESRYSTFTIRPPDTTDIDGMTTVKVVLGIESVAHIAQLTEAAFRALGWAIPT